MPTVILSSSPPTETAAEPPPKTERVTFQSEAPGRAGRPDEAVQALEALGPLQLVSGEAVVGDDCPHGEGGLQLGDVRVAVGRGERSQAACDGGKRREGHTRSPPCTDETREALAPCGFAHHKRDTASEGRSLHDVDSRCHACTLHGETQGSREEVREAAAGLGSSE